MKEIETEQTFQHSYPPLEFLPTVIQHTYIYIYIYIYLSYTKILRNRQSRELSSEPIKGVLMGKMEKTLTSIIHKLQVYSCGSMALLGFCCFDSTTQFCNVTLTLTVSQSTRIYVSSTCPSKLKSHVVRHSYSSAYNCVGLLASCTWDARMQQGSEEEMMRFLVNSFITNTG